MEKSMGLVNIISKMEIFMKDKCSRELCKAKANIHGKIKMSIKELLWPTKCVDMVSLFLQMEMFMRDNLSIIELQEQVK